MARGPKEMGSRKDNIDQQGGAGRESGKAIIWAVMFCAAMWGAYFKYGKAYMDANLSHLMSAMVIAVLGILSLFALGCALHLLFIGGQSVRSTRKNLHQQVKELDSFVQDACARVRQIEADLSRNVVQLRPRTLDSLSMARRILRPLSQLVSDVKDLVRSGNKIDVIDADEMLRRKLVIVENAMDALIGADPVPPLAPEEWVPTITRLLGEVEEEFRLYQLPQQAA